MHLSEMTHGELARTYNHSAAKIGRPTVRRFPSKAVAIRRIHEVRRLAAARGAFVPCEPQKTVRPLRRGTLREAALPLLLGGTTLEELTKFVRDWDTRRGVTNKPDGVRSRARGLVRVMTRDVGYGLRVNDGRLTLID